MAVETPTRIGSYRSAGAVAAGVVTLGAVAAGTFLVVDASGRSELNPGVAVSIADSKGNTWTLQGYMDQNVLGSYQWSAIWTCRVTTALAAGDTISVSRAPSGGVGVDVYSVAGVDVATPVTAANKAGTTTGGNIANPTTGPVASKPGDYVFAVMGIGSATIPLSAPTPTGAVILHQEPTTGSTARSHATFGRPTLVDETVNIGATAASTTRFACVVINLAKASGGNAPPSVNAGPDRAVDPNLTDTIDLAATATDFDGTIASVLWEDVTSGAVAIAGTGLTRKVPIPRSVTGTTRTYRVTVTDDDGATSAPDTVVITVLPHTEWVRTADGAAPVRHIV